MLQRVSNSQKERKIYGGECKGALPLIFKSCFLDFGDSCHRILSLQLCLQIHPFFCVAEISRSFCVSKNSAQVASGEEGKKTVCAKFADVFSPTHYKK